MELIPNPKKGKESIYKQCLRNHAVKMGGYAVDGCGEYFPFPSSNPSDATFLICAACGCHRNFHLRSDSGDGYNFDLAEEEATESDMLLLPKSLDVEKKKKRYRTKFNKEQKEKMLELAERVGWRLQRSEEGFIEEACMNIGITRKVFKVWLHNNKQAFLALKPKVTSDETGTVNDNSDGDSGEKLLLDIAPPA